MAFDLSDLQRASEAATARAKARAPKAGVAAMLAGLHRGELGGFVSIESVPLPPLPVLRDGAWTLTAALVVPTTPAGPEVHPPWALVCWAADGTVLRTTSLDSPSGGPFAWRPDRAGLGRLCRELDALLAQGPDADPSGLRSSYAALLSPELRAQLASLVPAAAALLA